MQKRIPILALAFFALFSPFITMAQQTVGLFTKNAGQEDGYVLFYPNDATVSFLIDKCGKNVHHWNNTYLPGLDSYILPNGNLLSTGRLTNAYFNNTGSIGGLLQEFDWNGKLLWHYAISDSVTIQNHDVYPLPNGDILVCEWERFTASQAAAMGRNVSKLGNIPVWSGKVQEIKPLGSSGATIVWQWRMWDHLIQDYDPTKPNYGVVADHPELLNINYVDTTQTGSGPSDWIHLNAVTYNEKLNQIMISSRNMSEIYIIDRSTTTAQAATHSGGKHGRGGDFMYRWGNPATYNRDSTGTRRTLWVQHNPSWIPDGYPGAGTISIFNDGTARHGQNYSSADVFTPPMDTAGNYYLAAGEAYGPDSAYWSYTAPKKTDFYSSVQGGAQRLPNGNMLICSAVTGNFFEVDSNKNVVWRYISPIGPNGVAFQGVNPGNNASFRCQWYSKDYSGFSNHMLRPGNPIELNPLNYVCNMPYNYVPVPLYNINQLTLENLADGTADSVNRGTGFIKGIVASQNIGPGGPIFSLIDSTGTIMVASQQIIGYYTPTIGDSIMIGGTEIQVNGMTEYVADTVFFKSHSNAVKKPDVLSQFTEYNEADLITIKDVHLVDSNQWAPNGEGFDVTLSNGTDTFTMYVDNNTDLFSSGPPREEFNVTGIEVQDQPAYPYYGSYRIVPRGIFDLQHVTQLYTIGQVRVQDPVTAIADSAGSITAFYVEGVVQSPGFNATGLEFSMMDSTGSIIVASKSAVSSYKPAIGDSIFLRGLLIQVNGLTEIVPDSISVLQNASPAINPAITTVLSENNEATLVTLKGYHLLDSTQWIPNSTGIDVDITNGTYTFIMHIGSATDLYGMTPLHGLFNVSGIVLQDAPTGQYLSDYEIAPRGLFDIQGYTPLYKIRDIRVQNPVTGVADSINTLFRFYLKGIVQSQDFATSGFDFSIKDSTGSIFVAATSKLNNYSPIVGDSIQVRGLLTQTNGLTVVVIDSVSNLGNNSIVISPKVVAKLTETNEATLVKMDNVWLTDPTQWVAAGSGFTVSITNGPDTSSLFISNATNVFSKPAPEGKFNVTGIVSQDQPTSPYFGNYLLMPRSFADFQSGPFNLYKIRDIKVYNATNGIADSINTYCLLKGIVQSGSLSKNASLSYAIADSTGSIMVTPTKSGSGYGPVAGDSIEVRGTVLQANGLTHFTADSVSKLSSGSPIAAVPVTTLNENTESELVSMLNYSLINPVQWDTTGANGVFTIAATNTVDTINMVIYKSTDLYSNAAKPVTYFNVTGIGSQNDPTQPFLSGYLLIPRSIADFSHSSGIAPANDPANNISIFPNPASSVLSIVSGTVISRIQATDIAGKLVYEQIPGNTNTTIDISTWSAGVYFLKINNNGNIITSKIIKE